MTTTLANVKRKYNTTETGLVASLLPKQWGYAADTRRIVAMEADGVTARYFWDAVSQADQTFYTCGTRFLGSCGVSGVTPTAGSVSAASDLQSLLEGLARYADDASTAVILAPTTAARNVIQPTADVVPLTVKGFSAGAAALQQWQKSDGTVYAYVDANGQFVTSRPRVGADLFMSVQNTDNTSAASNAFLSIGVGGASAGDPYVYFNILSASTWVMGLDNSDSDKFKICKNGTLGTNDYFTIDSAGAVKMAGTLDIATSAIIGQAGGTTLGALDVRSSALSGVIAAFGTKTANDANGVGMIYMQAEQEIDCGYNVNAGCTLLVNMNGYHGLDTEFRHLVIANGKGGYMMEFNATSSRITSYSDATFNQTLSVAGDFAINTNKFTVASSTGNTVIAGTLAVTGLSTFTGGTYHSTSFTSFDGVATNVASSGGTTNARMGWNSSTGFILQTQGNLCFTVTASTGAIAFASTAAITGAVIIGETATAVGMLDVRAANSSAIYASFGATAAFNAVDPGGIYMAGPNAINFMYNSNADDTGSINANGYLNGTTRFRSLVIGDGKTAAIATFTGSTKLVTLAGSLIVNGSYVQLPSLASAPGSPVNGMLYYDTSSGHIRGYAASTGGWGDLA